MAAQQVLLKNGTVVLHGPDDSVTCKKVDILITGNRISKIAEDISLPDSPSAKVIACDDKIISPGFVDAHHHLWETQLKGRHADETLMQYGLTGAMAASLYQPEDIFWGILAGALESVDSGTTTVVAYEHMVYSQEHIHQGLNALVASGIRAIYCPASTNRVTSWDDFGFDPETIPSWWNSVFSKLAGEQPWAGGRVSLGLGFDSYFLGEQKCTEVISEARRAGAKVISSHMSLWNNTAHYMKEMSLLGPDVLLVHANRISEADLASLRAAGGHICVTPASEMQMTHGHPICYSTAAKDICSLGVDCNSVNSASMVNEMRTSLQHARALATEQSRAMNKSDPLTLDNKTVEAFNLATIKGARAIRMEGDIGSIAEGKIADLVIWETTTPAMIAAAQHDPIVAIVAHSSPRDINTVIVDGTVRKTAGSLTPISLGDKGELEWLEVARQVLRSRAQIQRLVEKIDYPKMFGQARQAFMNLRAK